MRCQIQHNFKCIEYLCTLDKEYLISLTSKFCTFFLDEIWKLLTYHTPSYRPTRNCCKVVNSQKQSGFWPILYYHFTVYVTKKEKKVKVAHTGLPSVGFGSWYQFLAVSLQVTWIINLTVGCHYFPPGLQLPPQPLRMLLPILLLGDQRHNGCEQFA